MLSSFMKRDNLFEFGVFIYDILIVYQMFN